jgi:hypothetical protein
MRMSLNVWISEEVEVSTLLGRSGWIPEEGGGAHYSSHTYLAEAGSSTPVFPAEVPNEVTALLPGVAWMVILALEGMSPTGQRVLSKAATTIARAGHGVVEDPQQCVFRTPSGVRRYDKPVAGKKVTVVSLGWWAPGGPLLTVQGIAALYNCLQRLLPEGVPRRWGLGEPPDHSLSEERVEGLVSFIDEFRDDFLVFKVVHPCLEEHLQVHSQWGMRGGRFNRFETTHLRIDVEASVLNQPGWGRQLSRTFESVTEVIRPFYAEARVLEMAAWGRLGYDLGNSQLHPIQQSFWRGIPVSAPLAAALGDPYKAIWPDFPGPSVGNFLVASNEVWARGLTVHPWYPPPGLAQEFDGHWAPAGPGQVTRYATSWPSLWPFVPPDGTIARQVVRTNRPRPEEGKRPS